jgi:hypothetical protein
VISILALVFVITGAVVAIRFAKGYRPDFRNDQLQRETGLLVADSYPEKASVYLDGKLVTATDDTLNLPPNEYEIEIKKEGYHTWRKELSIFKELVTATNARLFPSVSSVTPLTFSGVLDPTPAPDGHQLVFKVVSSSTEEDNGLYVINMNGGSLFRRINAKQIARNSLGYDFSQAELVWSTDTNKILAYWVENEVVIQAVELEADKFNEESGLRDVSTVIDFILDEWLEEVEQEEEIPLAKLPEELRTVLAEARSFFFSPDGEMLLYTVGEQASSLPEDLIADLPAESTQAEERELKPGYTYVYDIKEDRNYEIVGPEEQEILAEKEGMLAKARELSENYSGLFVNQVQWFPTSRHLVMANQESINLVEYDGQNLITIFTGLFQPGFICPAPSGQRLLFVSNLGQKEGEVNLYSLDLK